MPYKVSDPVANKEHAKDNRQGPDWLKLESGKNGRSKKTWIRILPVLDTHPTDTFFLWVKVHFGVGQQNRSVACLTPYDQFCPLCEEAQRIEATGVKREDVQIRAKYRCIMNVMEYNEDGSAEEKVKVWSVGSDTFGSVDDKTEGYAVDDPENGYDIWVERRGKDRDDTRYSVGLAEAPSPLLGGDFADLLDNLYDLTKVYEPLDTERLVLLLQGGGRTDPWEDEAPVIEGDYREVPSLPEPQRAPARGRVVTPEPEPDPEEPEGEEPPDDESLAEARFDGPYVVPADMPSGEGPSVAPRGRAPAGRPAAPPAAPAAPAGRAAAMVRATTPAPARGRAVAPAGDGPVNPGEARKRLAETLNEGA